MSTERDDLYDLLANPGWARFKAEATAVWGDEHVIDVVRAAVHAGDLAAVHAAIATQTAVRGLLAYPEERLVELRNEEVS